MIGLKVKRLHPAAQIPRYAHEGDACFDLHAIIVKEGVDLTLFQNIQPGEARTIRTGLAFEIPPGWVMKVYSRSGHGFNHGIRLANGTGIIDATFRGELLLKLHNDSGATFSLMSGDRLAQAMLERVEPVEFVEVDELDDTARGTGGFGSTGQ